MLSATISSMIKVLFFSLYVFTHLFTYATKTHMLYVAHMFFLNVKPLLLSVNLCQMNLIRNFKRSLYLIKDNFVCYVNTTDNKDMRSSLFVSFKIPKDSVTFD